MTRFIFITIITWLLFASPGLSQTQMTVEEYIDTYKDLAVEEMKKHRIPASITLAQGILESGTGNSDLARLAHNHFGIKCHTEWTGKTFTKDDDEKDECFRKYKSALESYRDHSYFLTSRDRYNFLFDLEITDYEGWAYGLKQAGYATNPRYPEMLIKIIEENGLAELDGGRGQRSAVSGQRSVASGELATAGGQHSGIGGQRSKHKINHSEHSNQNSELITQNSKLKTPELVGRGGNDRVIFLNNGVKFILAREGDDFQQVASEFNIYSWQVRDYNDLKKTDKLVSGQKVYLERKQTKAEFRWHKVKAGETLHSVSQDFGVRLKTLCRLNGIPADYELEEGEVVRMR